MFFHFFLGGDFRQADLARRRAQAPIPANPISQAIPPSRMLQYGATILPLAAEVLGFVELGPIGVAAGLLTLAAMAWDDWNKSNTTKR